MIVSVHKSGLQEMRRFGGIKMEHVLEMKYPSSWWHDQWREGLVTGNGFTGANLYGGAKREILQIGRHDFWMDGEAGELPDVHDAFERLRRKMDEGNYREASWEIVNELKKKGYDSSLEKHVPMARMIVEQVPVKGFRNFSRKLFMERGVASQEWMDGGILMGREVFVSRVKDEIVYRLTARKGAADEGFDYAADSGDSGLEFENTGLELENSDLYLDSVHYTAQLNAYVNEGEEPTSSMQAVWDSASVAAVCEESSAGYLFFNAKRESVSSSCRDFGAAAKVIIKKGRIREQDKCLEISGAGEVLIRIRTYMGEEKEAAWARLRSELDSVDKTFEELLAESEVQHKELYHSAELTLGSSDSKEADVGTEDSYGRWTRCSEELVMEAFSYKQSPELIEKLWHYGRYLFICGTNPAANPFPLYGLWGGAYRPMWCHNMANENLQMIYWHSLCGNLAEYNQSVFKYMNDRIPAFTDNGEKLFGIRGIYMTAGTTPGVAEPTQVVPVIINWVGAAGWIAQHYYQYFLYTQDYEYAKNIMVPFMDGVAKFYEEFVRFTRQENKEERIRFYPSVSPENTPENFMPKARYSMAHPMPTTINSTIDLAILKEFFTEMLDIRERMQDGVFAQERVQLWKRILKAIPEYELNEKGAVKEWQEEIFEDRYDHRHLSHIYPVFPGHEFYPEKDPGIIPGFIKAVKLRKIDAQTGWSMAHMAAIYARFRDGDTAMECLDNLARSSLLPNFFTLHNDWRGMNISLNMDPAPVQLDAILGYVNAIQEMLLYASDGYLALLPALEERLYKGKAENFRYQDGFVSMEWNVEEKTFKARLSPVRPHRLELVLPDFVKDPVFEGLKEEQVLKLRQGVWSLDLRSGSVTIKSAKSVAAIGE